MRGEATKIKNKKYLGLWKGGTNTFRTMTTNMWEHMRPIDGLTMEPSDFHAVNTSASDIEELPSLSVRAENVTVGIKASMFSDVMSVYVSNAEIAHVSQLQSTRASSGSISPVDTRRNTTQQQLASIG